MPDSPDDFQIPEVLTIHAKNWQPQAPEGPADTTPAGGSSPIGETAPKKKIKLTPVPFDPFPDASDPLATARAYLGSLGVTAPQQSTSPDVLGDISQFLYGNKQGFTTAGQQLEKVPAGWVQQGSQAIGDQYTGSQNLAQQGVQNIKQGNLVGGIPQTIVGTVGQVLSPATGIVHAIGQGMDPFLDPGAGLPPNPALTSHMGHAMNVAPHISPTDFIPAMFGGPAALTANLDKLNIAKDLAAKGGTKEAIFDQTGWWQNPAGEWQFVIPDTGAKRVPYGTVGLGLTKPQVTLGDVLQHPGLQQAYPEIMNTPVERQRNQGAMYHSPGEGIPAKITLRPSLEDDFSNLTHEAMHATQTKEGYSGGGYIGDESIIQEGKKLAASRPNLTEEEGIYLTYLSLVGEVNARNAARRASMTPEELAKAPYPWSTEDIPESKQLKVEDIYAKYGGESGAAESFDKPYPINWKDESKATFSSPNGDYKIHFNPMGNSSNFFVSFYGSNGRHDITGAEPYESQKVFATVMDSIKQYANNNPKLTHATFSAINTEPSRVKLYRMLANRLSRSVKESQSVATDSTRFDISVLPGDIKTKQYAAESTGPLQDQALKELRETMQGMRDRDAIERAPFEMEHKALLSRAALNEENISFLKDRIAKAEASADTKLKPILLGALRSRLELAEGATRTDLTNRLNELEQKLGQAPPFMERSPGNVPQAPPLSDIRQALGAPMRRRNAPAASAPPPKKVTLTAVDQDPFSESPKEWSDRPLYRGGPSLLPPIHYTERGAFGPGVYVTEHEANAQIYGNIIHQMEARGKILDLTKSVPREDMDRILQSLSPEERTKFNSFPESYMYDGKGFWEALRRSMKATDSAGADKSASQAIQKAGFSGMEGIADGHELVVFDPKDIRVKNTGFIVYHGSPHDFDQFDISKIGTGEGAQSYGHGLYFAGNEDIGKHYRDALGVKTIDGKSISELADQYNTYNSNSGEKSPSLDAKIAAYIQDYGSPKNARFVLDQPGQNDAIIKRLDDLVSTGRLSTQGKMYKVKINADPEHFLDWDKPLSKQSPHVQQAVAEHSPVLDWYQKNNFSTKNIADYTGEDLVSALREKNYQNAGGWKARANGSEEAAEALKKSGVPGIKYRDASSRATAQEEADYASAKSFEDQLRKKMEDSTQRYQDAIKKGASSFLIDITKSGLDRDTHALEAAKREADALRKKVDNPTSNYVVFDDKTARILKKYGLAGLGIGLGGAAASLAEGQQSPASAEEKPTRFKLTPVSHNPFPAHH